MAANLPPGFSVDQPDETQSPPGAPPSGFQLDEDKYGTAGQQALTVGEGLAKGALSRPVVAAAERGATALGIPGLTPEDQAGRASANPWESGLSEGAGFIAPAVATLGASAEAQGALAAASKLSQAGVVGQLGEGAAKLAGLGGEGASAISKIAAGGIKTGTEMAALQAADEGAKLINGDPDTVGDAAINIGLSGIIGGAGGSIVGAVSPLWKASMEKMGVPKLIDDAKAQYNFRKNLPNGGDVASTIVDEANTRLSEVDNLRSQMGNLKGSSLARAMPAVTPENTLKIDNQIQGIANTMTESIEKASDNAYLKGSVPKLAQDFNDFMEVATNPESTYEKKFDAVDKLKRALQEKSNYNLSSEDSALGKFTKNIARDFRLSLEDEKVWGEAASVQSKVNSAIKASIDAEKDAAGKFTSKLNVEGGRVADPTKINTLVNQSGKGKAGLKTNIMHNYLEATQDLADTINKIHTDAGLKAPIRLSPTPALDHTLGRSSAGTTLGNWLFDKGLASAAGHVAGESVGAGLGSLVGHPVFGALAGERLLSPAFTSIAKPLLENASRSEGMKASLDYAVNVLKGNKILSQSVENLFKSGSEIVPQKLLPNAASREKAEKSLQYASNPDNVMNIGSGIGHYMPNHATAASSAAARASNYFNQLKPKQSQGSPLDKPTPVDKAQQAVYNRQLDIAQQPLLVLKYAKDGTLQQQDMKTVAAVYPGLLKKIANQSYQEMIKATAEGKQIPYKQRVSLSLLMGQPLDSTMTTQTMQSIIMANAPKAPPPVQAGKQKKVSKPTATSMQKSASMLQTSSQARAADKIKG